jgi:hypothetical protein
MWPSWELKLAIPVLGRDTVHQHFGGTNWLQNLHDVQIYSVNRIYGTFWHLILYVNRNGVFDKMATRRHNLEDP